jgi:hypothetical protein
MSDFAVAMAKIDTLQARLAPLVAPLMVGAPVVTGIGRVGNALSCSNGAWDHAPSSFAYQWKSAAANVGTSVPNYAPVSGDVGKAITCVVTATNAMGSTAASPSNGVQIIN